MSAISFDAVISTPLPGSWRVGFGLQAGRLSTLDFLPPRTPLVASGRPEVQRIAELLTDYFQDPHTTLRRIPLAPARTPFQARVRELMSAIPVGQTRSYGELAGQLRTASRAVAGACRANPVALVVPCHRVVSVSGPGGFMGAVDGPPLELKAWLLKHESV
ncbi:methylated-DNA--[protein]-cysteine S-methyltransferase [Thiohalomonas denitrificans]|uniref:Methylated-DNA-[protein]-cysteine S-methyltransferase n=1 Tax=Thiohalomonas denitrificans TaxID=415747 RepID=A0A1G5PJM7_9GAMM|nr:methylated-DNA--[protein]-cysteine S-methyltransferase [Thiohalomonas denitrificans]SCZ49712.1 methylated-DNA-[protein]-cysteine S-methyltransferase [Thiohalomonas denitrificans]